MEQQWSNNAIRIGLYLTIMRIFNMSIYIELNWKISIMFVSIKGFLSFSQHFYYFTSTIKIFGGGNESNMTFFHADL